MRIVIDGRLWSESGLGRYIRNLVLELQKIDQLNDYLILLLQKDFDTVKFQTNNFHKVLANFKWYGVQEQIKLPKLLKDLSPDLVHFPHFNVPILYDGKFVVTIHDLIHQHFVTRETSTLNPLFHKIKKFGYKKVFSHAVKNSATILTPSEFVKKQLISEWRVNDDKIVVTYEGVDWEIIKKIKEIKENDFSEIAKKFKITKPYLFYIGNAQPHKNLSRLIAVFSKLKEKHHELNLVLSGPNHYFWEKIKQESNLDDVIFTGFISELEMVVLYKNAQAFIMPSLEEGFGIPVLEAMACECPVVSSNAASLPEVGGPPALGAVVYFDPEDEEDMFKRINYVLTDKKLQKELVEKGKKRYQEFSWQKLAEQTLKLYQQV